MQDNDSKRVKIAIDQSGYSFVELQKRTGIPQATIQRYAVGKTTKIPTDAIKKIANATNASPAYLFGISDDPHYYHDSNKKRILYLYIPHCVAVKVCS